MTITTAPTMATVNSPNCGHFGTQASVLYLESVLYSGGGVISSPICVVITVIMLFKDYHAYGTFGPERFKMVASC